MMIDKFNEWYEGVFDNREQAFGRPVHFIYVRITHVKLDNGFFYGEQQNVWKTYPYRQFVSKPIQDGDKIVNKTYRVNGDLHIGFLGFLDFLGFLGISWISWIFLDFLDFFWISWILLDFLDFL